MHFVRSMQNGATADFILLAAYATDATSMVRIQLLLEMKITCIDCSVWPIRCPDNVVPYGIFFRGRLLPSGRRGSAESENVQGKGLALYFLQSRAMYRFSPCRATTKDLFLTWHSMPLFSENSVEPNIMSLYKRRLP